MCPRGRVCLRVSCRVRVLPCCVSCVLSLQRAILLMALHLILLNPPAPQGAVPKTHQAHQDRLGISLADPALKAVHWNPRSAASGSIGLVSFCLSLVHARHRCRYRSHTSRSGLGPQGQFRGQNRAGQEVPAYVRDCCMRTCSVLQGTVHAVSDPQHYNPRCSCYQSQAILAIIIGEPRVPDVHLESLAEFPGWQC